MPFYNSFYNSCHFIQSLAGDFDDTGHETKVETDSNYVKHTVQTSFTMEHNMAYSTTTDTSTTAL